MLFPFPPLRSQNRVQIIPFGLLCRNAHRTIMSRVLAGHDIAFPIRIYSPWPLFMEPFAAGILYPGMAHQVDNLGHLTPPFNKTHIGPGMGYKPFRTMFPNARHHRIRSFRIHHWGQRRESEFAQKDTPASYHHQIRHPPHDKVHRQYPGSPMVLAVGNQQKWDTFVKERSGGNGSVVGLPEQVVVAFAAG